MGLKYKVSKKKIKGIILNQEEDARLFMETRIVI